VPSDVIAWASAGYLLCFITGWIAGTIYKSVQRVAEAAANG